MVAESGGKWDIPRDELKFDQELGRGNFGIVHKGNSTTHQKFHINNVQVTTYFSIHI